MGEFMTQPLQVWHLAVIAAFMVLGWLVTFMVHIDHENTSLPGHGHVVLKETKVDNWQLRKQVDELESCVNRCVININRFSNDQDALTETVESMSDTLWAIEDDIEALRSPAWKKLLRKLSE